MKIVAILGSRNHHGQTARACDALLKGAAGAKVSRLFLPELKIDHCHQCEPSGWGSCLKKGKCSVADDFVKVSDAIRKADAVVFATPVYFSDLSESLRAFLDRLRRTSWREAGNSGIAGKPAVGICVAGGGGGGAPNCAVSLERVLTTCGFDVLDLVAVRRQNLPMKQKTLKILGKWLVTGRRA
jgi:multimeric flavodoxin WrbA